MIAYVEIRSQSPKGSWPKSGPDRYVAVQIVPDGVERLSCLNRAVAERRGITIEYIGEGYYNRVGPTSSFGKAVAKAKDRANEINGDNEQPVPLYG